MSDLNLGLVYSLDDKDLEEIKEKVLDEVYENQLSSDNINENLLLLKKQNDPELYKKTLVVKQLLNSKTIIKDDKNKGFLITDQDELRNAKKRATARAVKKALLENLKTEKENTHVQRKINSYSEEQKRKLREDFNSIQSSNSKVLDKPNTSNNNMQNKNVSDSSSNRLNNSEIHDNYDEHGYVTMAQVVLDKKARRIKNLLDHNVGSHISYDKYSGILPNGKIRSTPFVLSISSEKREQLEKNGVSSLIEQCRNNYNSKIQDEDFKRSSNYDFGDR